MAQKSQTHRDNISILGSEMTFQKNRAKSALNIAAISSTTNQADKNSQRTQNAAETRQTNSKTTTRNFSFSFGAVKETHKKNYLKNSEKTIKPPEKPLKSLRTPTTFKQTALSQRERTTTSIARANATLKNGVQSTGQGQRQLRAPSPGLALKQQKRSLTYDNINPQQNTLNSPYARIDLKAIEELARRLEHLQTIFLNKLELLHSREPNSMKTSYKLVAMVVGDEAKLLVRESDAQRLPRCIPARSVEDLNIKINKFFTGCLIAFTDKLRSYQHENQPINCDEIYKELKRDEQIFCAILKDWVFEMCDEADTTLIANDTEKFQGDQRKPVSVREFGTQSDLVPPEQYDNMSDKEFVDLINLRVEVSELKLQLSRKDENYMGEIGKLKEQFESKINELNKSLLIEETIGAAKDDKINKAQELNENLSQQLQETSALLESLTKRNDELNAKLQNENDLATELKKVREEFQNIRQENSDLNEMKTNFLRKLNQRATRIDLLEKEIKQQKRKMELQNKEIEDLKQEFGAKVKENREYKESLDARNQLIDHLRKAVEIEQRKRKECEQNAVNISANEDKPFSTGVKFKGVTSMQNEPKHFHKRGDVWKRNFNETTTTINFAETMPVNIKAPLSAKTANAKVPDNKLSFEIQPHLFDLNIPKDSSDISSTEEMIAVRERFRKRKTRTATVKKRA